jgi:Outer membrane lipoprotein carrier protein LolA-like
MISGIALLTLALLSATPPALVPPPDAPAADAAALIARLARPVPSSTQYTEVRFVRLLKKPLLMHGQLDYAGAGKLGKRVEQPYRETTTIDAGTVEMQREGRAARHFPLDRAPELQGLLAGFSALLGGDAAALGNIFAIGIVDNASKWTLTLTPHQAELARHLHEIVVDGAGNEPHCFSLHETDGDASVMLLGALAAAALPDPPTRAALDAICQRVAP